MDFDLTEDQKEIKRTARDLLAARSPCDKVREAAESGAVRRRAVEASCASSAGRASRWPRSTAARASAPSSSRSSLEELGYACRRVAVPVDGARPRPSSRRRGTDEQQAKWLPGLASGEHDGGHRHGRAVRRRGRRRRSSCSSTATRRRSSTELGDASSRSTTIDPTRRYGTVAGAGGEPLGADARRPRPRRDRGAEVVGVSQRALDMTLEYVKDRKQFGVARRRLPGGGAPLRADAARHRERALGGATTRRGPRTPTPSACRRRPRSPAAAAADGGRDVTASAIQAHGGIGFTWEADVHWLYKRAQLDPRCSAARGGIARRSRESPSAGRGDGLGSAGLPSGNRASSRRPPSEVGPPGSALRAATSAGSDGGAAAGAASGVTAGTGLCIPAREPPAAPRVAEGSARPGRRERRMLETPDPPQATDRAVRRRSALWRPRAAGAVVVGLVTAVLAARSGRGPAAGALSRSTSTGRLLSDGGLLRRVLVGGVVVAAVASL